MGRYFLLLNVFLVLLSILFSWKIADVWWIARLEQPNLQANLSSIPDNPKIPSPPTAQRNIYDIIYRKDLFSDSRTFHDPATGPAKPATPTAKFETPQDLQLIGVIMVGTGSDAALIRIPGVATQGATKSYRVSQKVGNYTLRDIESNQVILEKGPQQYRLFLKGARPATATTMTVFLDAETAVTIGGVYGNTKPGRIFPALKESTKP